MKKFEDLKWDTVENGLEHDFQVARLTLSNYIDIIVYTGEFTLTNKDGPYEVVPQRNGQVMQVLPISSTSFNYLTKDGVTKVMAQLENMKFPVEIPKEKARPIRDHCNGLLNHFPI